MTIFEPKYIQVCTIKDALVVYRGNQSKLASDLGINRGTLRTYIKNGAEHLLQVHTKEGQVTGFKLINK